MKPIKLNIDGIDIIIKSLKVSENGKFIDISYDYNGNVNKGKLNKKVQKFVLKAIETSVHGVDIE
jgi:hypothetical protein